MAFDRRRPDARGPVAAVANARPAPAPAKEKVRSVAFKPQPAPRPPRREIERVAEPAAEYATQRIESPPSRKFPVISFIAEKLPNGRDIGNAMASMGKRVSSIFTRG